MRKAVEVQQKALEIAALLRDLRITAPKKLEEVAADQELGREEADEEGDDDDDDEDLLCASDPAPAVCPILAPLARAPRRLSSAVLAACADRQRAVRERAVAAVCARRCAHARAPARSPCTSAQARLGAGARARASAARARARAGPCAPPPRAPVPATRAPRARAARDARARARALLACPRALSHVRARAR